MSRRSDSYDYRSRRDYPPDPPYSDYRDQRWNHRPREPSPADERRRSYGGRTESRRRGRSREGSRERSRSRQGHPSPIARSPLPRSSSTTDIPGRDPRQQPRPRTLNTQSLTKTSPPGHDTESKPANGAVAGNEDVDMLTETSGLQEQNGAQIARFTKALMDFANVVSTVGMLKFQQSLAHNTFEKLKDQDEKSKGLPNGYASIQLQSSNQKKAAEIDLRKKNDAVKGAVGKVETMAAQLGEMMAAATENESQDRSRMLQEEFAAVDKRCEELENGVRFCREKLDLLKKTTDLIPDTLQTQKRQESKLSSIYSSIGHIRDTIATLGNQFAETNIRAEVDDLKDAYARLQSEKSKPIDITTSVQDDMEALKTRLQSLGRLPERFDSLTINITSHTEVLANLSAQVEGLRNSLAESRDGSSIRLSKLEEEFDLLQGLQEPMAKAIAEEIDALKARSTHQDYIVSGHGKEITELSKSNESTLSHLNELTREVQQHVKNQKALTIAIQSLPTSTPLPAPPSPVNGAYRPQEQARLQPPAFSPQPPASSPPDPAVRELKSGFSSFRNELQALAAAVRTLDGRYNNLTTEPLVRAMTQTLSNMYPSAKNAEAEIRLLKQEIKMLKMSDNDQKTRHAALKEEVSKLAYLSVNLKALETTLSELEAVQNRNAEKDQRNVEMMTKAKSDIEEQLTALRKRVDDGLAGQEETLENNMARQTSLYAQVDTKIRTLEGQSKLTQYSNGPKVDVASDECVFKNLQSHSSGNANGKSTVSRSANNSPARTPTETLKRSLLLNKKRKASDRASSSEDEPIRTSLARRKGL